MAKYGKPFTRTVSFGRGRNPAVLLFRYHYIRGGNKRLQIYLGKKWHKA